MQVPHDRSGRRNWNQAENCVCTYTSEPKPFAGGKTLHVYPADFKGSKEKPAFVGLKSAYEGAEPGDIILVHAGLYQSDRTKYLDYLRKGSDQRYLEHPGLRRAEQPKSPLRSRVQGTARPFSMVMPALFFSMSWARIIYTSRGLPSATPMSLSSRV